MSCLKSIFLRNDWGKVMCSNHTVNRLEFEQFNFYEMSLWFYNFQAGRHSYYGGTCCQSCRAFFRRCVKTDHYHSLACCKMDMKCKVTISTRKKCMACRFNKCLQAGGLYFKHIVLHTKTLIEMFFSSENISIETDTATLTLFFLISIDLLMISSITYPPYLSYFQT